MTLELQYYPLKSLVPYAKNSRLHSRAQLQKIKSSMGHYGWTNPMLVADHQMIAGHARLQVAMEMAEAGVDIPRNPDPWKGPVVDLSHLSEADRTAYVIMDNRSALDGSWDEEILSEELGALYEAGIDLTLTGFDDFELTKLLSGSPDSDADLEERSEPPLHPVTQLGDVWLLGAKVACPKCGKVSALKRAQGK